MTPLILTLRLDDAAFGYFDALRQRHFPPERNFLRAHLTLFHHLPDTPELLDQVAAAAAPCSPMVLQVTGLQKLGNGVAYRLECSGLLALHRQLQQTWLSLLKPQDRQPLRPHITIQNKVSAAEAASLHAQLEAGFQPFEARGLGVDLWQYLNGPWAFHSGFLFGQIAP